MKLHLPVRLFQAVLAVMSLAGGAAFAAEIPEEYTNIKDVYDTSAFVSPGSNSVAFILKTDVTIENRNSTVFSDIGPLPPYIYSSDWYVTSETDESGEGLHSMIIQGSSFVYNNDEHNWGETLFSVNSFSVDQLAELTWTDNKMEQTSAWDSLTVFSVALASAKTSFSNIGKINLSNNSASAYGAANFATASGGALLGTVNFSSNGNIECNSNSVYAETSPYDEKTAAEAVNGYLSFWKANKASIIKYYQDAIDEHPKWYPEGSTGESVWQSYYEELEKSSYSPNDSEFAEAKGGFFEGIGITFAHNGNLDFVGNKAVASGNCSKYSALGGAIHTIAGSASPGYGVTIENNDNVHFSGNYAEVVCTGIDNSKVTQTQIGGGAVYVENGKLHILNNEDVLFEKNYIKHNNEYRLQSIYTQSTNVYDAVSVQFSASGNNKIEFRDSILLDNTMVYDYAQKQYVDVSPEVDLNATYTDADGKSIAQTGDIIFNGEYAEQHLNEILAERGEGRTATAEEVQASQTSEIKGTVTLHDGRLIVKGGAVLKVDELEVAGSVSGESTTTLELEDATICGNDTLARTPSLSTLSFDEGTRFILRGFNTVNTSEVNMAKGSALEIFVTEAHRETAALSSTGSLNLEGTVTLHLTQGSQTLSAGSYILFDLEDETATEGITFNVTGLDAGVIIGEDGVITMVLEDAVSVLDGMSANQQAAHEAALEIVAGGEASGLLKEMATLATESMDSAEVGAILDELSGREYASAMSSQLEGNLAHLRRLRANAGTGLPLSASDIVQTDEKGNSVAVGKARRWGAGISVFHDETSVDADARGDGYDRSETGAMLTVEYAVKDSLTLGAAVSQSRTNLRPSYGNRRHEDNTHIDLYGVYRSGKWSAVSAIGLGIHEHDMERRVAGQNTSGTADGYSINLLQEVAYTTWQNEKNSVQVYGAIESSLNHIDGFRETGADTASLHVGNMDAWATDVTVGARWNHALTPLGDAPAGLLSVGTGIVASLGDLKDTARMSYVGAPGTGFCQDSATRNRWGWEVSAAVQLPVSESTSIYGAAETVLRGDSFSVDGQVGVKYVF